PTPTAAAELVAPATGELLDGLQRHVRQLRRVQMHRLQAAAQRLDYAQRTLSAPRLPLASLDNRVGMSHSRIIAAGARALEQRRASLAAMRQRLQSAPPTLALRRPEERLATIAAHSARRLNACSLTLASLTARLHSMDPHAVLSRGYSIAIGCDGHAVTDAATLAQGAVLQLTFAHGQARAQVQSVLLPDEQDRTSDNRASGS
ncbi:MAG: exodeoxyribonuclease VII large subunit, partial [Burkholderiaceae bacterium]